MGGGPCGVGVGVGPVCSYRGRAIPLADPKDWVVLEQARGALAGKGPRTRPHGDLQPSGQGTPDNHAEFDNTGLPSVHGPPTLQLGARSTDAPKLRTLDQPSNGDDRAIPSTKPGAIQDASSVRDQPRVPVTCVGVERGPPKPFGGGGRGGRDSYLPRVLGGRRPGWAVAAPAVLRGGVS